VPQPKYNVTVERSNRIASDRIAEIRVRRLSLPIRRRRDCGGIEFGGKVRKQLIWSRCEKKRRCLCATKDLQLTRLHAFQYRFVDVKCIRRHFMLIFEIVLAAPGIEVEVRSCFQHSSRKGGH
jgi:hypothetical protein